MAHLIGHVTSAAGVALGGSVDPSFMDATRELVGATVTGGARAVVEPTDALQHAVLAYAEQLAADPHGVTDAMVEALNRSLSPGVVVALTIDLGMADALARLEALLGSGA